MNLRFYGGWPMLLLCLVSCTLHMPFSGNPVICFEKKCRTNGSSPRSGKPKIRKQTPAGPRVIAPNPFKEKDKSVALKANDTLPDTVAVPAVVYPFTIISDDPKKIIVHLFFAFDTDTLDKEDTDKLNVLHNYISSLKYRNISINGHTDNLGGEEYNMRLSTDRARKVFSFLKSKGIAEDHLNYQGLGFHQPYYDNNTEDGRKLNRRVEVVISKE